MLLAWPELPRGFLQYNLPARDILLLEYRETIIPGNMWGEGLLLLLCETRNRDYTETYISSFGQSISRIFFFCVFISLRFRSIFSVMLFWLILLTSFRTMLRVFAPMFYTAAGSYMGLEKIVSWSVQCVILYPWPHVGCEIPEALRDHWSLDSLVMLCYWIYISIMYTYGRNHV